jgi:hypothetical protein
MGKSIREAPRALELEPVSLSELIHREIRVAIETAVHEDPHPDRPDGAGRAHPAARHAVRGREGMDVEDRSALPPANAGGE